LLSFDNKIQASRTTVQGRKTAEELAKKCWSTRTRGRLQPPVETEDPFRLQPRFKRSCVAEQAAEKFTLFFAVLAKAFMTEALAPMNSNLLDGLGS
jgi:hypothetical protein